MSIKSEYKPLTIPKVTWDKKSLTNTYGALVAQPLEPGFGITLGNALRRILLGAVEGSAVTAVIIKGINNEFSSVPGVVEDAMQILLNIKQIVIYNKEGRPGQMTLKVSGSGVARVANIVADEHLELVNKEHVIATVAADGDLDITFFVESGRGYRIAQWPIGQALQEDGRIYLDAMFSPVRKVLFDVEKARVGRDIDHDKLLLQIYTDGSESPADVLHYAISVLGSQLEHFLVLPKIPFNDISAAAIVEEDQASAEQSTSDFALDPATIEFLLKPVDELELSARAHNCLVSSGKRRILDLVNMTEDEVLKLKNFGRKSLVEVKESMSTFNLSFGSNIRDEDIENYLKNKNKK